MIGFLANIAIRGGGLIRSAWQWAMAHKMLAALIALAAFAAFQTWRYGNAKKALEIVATKLATANKVNRENVATCKAAIAEQNAAVEGLAAEGKRRTEAGLEAVRQARKANAGLRASAGRLEAGTRPTGLVGASCDTPEAVLEAVR